MIKSQLQVIILKQKKNNMENLNKIYFFILLIICLLASCIDESKKDHTIMKYNFTVTDHFSGKIKYFSSYYDYQSHMKKIYYGLDSDFSQAISISFIEEKVFVHGDTLICDGYNFTPSMKVNDCLTIRYTSELVQSYEDMNLCLDEVKIHFKLNDLLIDTCYVFSVTDSNLPVDSYNSKIYFDFSRRMMVKEESIGGNGEVVATVELVGEIPVDSIP